RENADMRMDLAYILSNCYHTGNEIYNLEFARKVHSSLLQELGLENRGIKRAPFYVLAWTRMPSILVELGFVSNPGDKQKLLSESFRQRAAEALYEGIKDFYNSFSKSLVKANAN
ncbi:N-acetylmuramoyl-L-alanine amidase, partial [Candidatus Poribacteria bacterium]|nr:N-acetylmuramoyl-L-alanine amidase [Candidatus Poribacteria bacterium]